MRACLVIVALVPLVSCGRFAPDRNLQRRVSENEIVGRWRLLASSLDVVKKDAGYRPAEASRPHDIVFRADGTCHFRSIDEAPPTRTEYLDAEATWKLAHYPPFSDATPNEVQISDGVRGIKFNLAEVKGHLHLWQFWGDPDEWSFLEYEKT